MHGFVNIYKPRGIPSTHATSRIKRMFRGFKVGHAGTLDPAAEGVLPIAVGEATKLIFLLQDARKTYNFRIKFGQQTTTGDSEGEVINTSLLIPSSEQISAILPQFLGQIMQVPHSYSAIKIGGQNAYQIMREGGEVNIAPRAINIYNLSYTSGMFTVECSKGTYVRSLAEDIASKLCTYGYVDFLQRSSVGLFSTNNIISLDSEKDVVIKTATPIEAMLGDIPVLHLSGEQAGLIKNGVVLVGSNFATNAMVALFFNNKLLALANQMEKGLVIKRGFFANL